MKHVNWGYCLLSVCFWLSQSALSFETVQITQARAQLSPEGIQTSTETVQFPFRWDSLYPSAGGKAIFTMQLPVVADQHVMGLFIARIGNQAKVSINGQAIALLGDLNSPNADYAKLPQWLAIPSALLTAHGDSKNTLTIELSTQAGRWGGISTIAFGSQNDLKPRYDSNYRTRTFMNLVICLSFLLMGGIVFALWLKQRETLYLIFVLAASSGVVRTADRLMVSPPLDWPWWGILYSSSLGFLMLSLCAFSLCLIDRLHFKEALALWLQAVFTLACASLALMLPMPKIWTFALMALMPTCLYVMWRVTQACQAQHSKRAWVLLIVFIFLAAIGLRDFIAVRWQSSGMDTSSYLPHAMFVFVLVMAGMIVNRYSLHFQQAKQLSEHLSEEVDKKEAQIKHAYELINEQTRENAMMLERQRMMSDIHDGVGAQLVSLVNQTQKQAFNQDQVREQASAALDELRIAVDALQPSEGDLLLVLATLRYRLEPRLKACGIELVWLVQALPNVEQLGSHRVIQIQRIVYQAISNIIEHSKATQVVMSASLVNEQIALSISDNGCGFDINTPRLSSVGLQSMAHRAKDIDAVLTITSGAKGTNITLTIAR